jgi:hypothetical protein
MRCFLGRGYRERTLVGVRDPELSARGRRSGRLRWKLRGAMLWPAFVVATVLEMALLHWLPVQGDATGWIGGLLAAGCLNLIAVVLAGTLGGIWLRRRRPDMPKVVADNYAGTAVLGVVALSLVVAGVLHRPSITDRRAAFGEQSEAVRTWVGHHGDAFARAHVARADSLLMDEDLYRTCVPTRDPKRALCLIVDTSVSPPAIRRDRSREPNASLGRGR